MMIPQLEQLSEELSENEKQVAIFRRLFTTEDGQFVLARLLEKLKFLEPCENERDMALNNFAKELLMTIYWDTEKGRTNTSMIFNLIRKLIRKRSK